MTDTLAELVVLGSALYHPRHAGDILGPLNAFDFTDPKHQAIYLETRRIYDAGVEPTVTAVYAALAAAARTNPAAAEAIPLLPTAAAAAVPPASAWWFRRDILAATLRRAMTAAGTKLTQIADETSDDELIAAVWATMRDLRTVVDRVTAAIDRATPAARSA